MKKNNNDDLVITQQMEMPDDFWNYLVNPVLGYYNGKRIERHVAQNSNW